MKKCKPKFFHISCVIVDWIWIIETTPFLGLDISDLIVYDAANGAERENEQSKSNVIIHEIRSIIPVEEKNLILQDFSDILIKCNSLSLFQEIVTIVDGLKARVECEELLSPTQNFISRWMVEDNRLYKFF